MSDESDPPMFLVVVIVVGLFVIGAIVGSSCEGGRARERGYREGIEAVCAPSTPLLTADGKFARCSP